MRVATWAGLNEVDGRVGTARLDLVRAMGVTRTPTTFILNSQGDIVGKSVGLPKRLEVLNVVEAVTANA